MGSSFTVAVDARAASGAYTGIGRYTMALVTALRDAAPDLSMLVIVTEAARAGFGVLEGPRVELHATSMEVSRHPAADFWLHVTLPALMRQRSIPLLFSCANYLPALSGGARRILTIHDLVPFRHPELDPWTFVVYLRSMLRLGARVADRIVAVSEATAGEIVEILGVDRQRIDVIYNGVQPAFRKLSAEELERRRLDAVGDGPFLLGVGARIPRKNFGRLIEAVALLRKRGFPHRLVIAGPPGLSQPELERLVEAHGLGSAVVFIGYADDEMLLTLYNRAALFVYPSIYEGFGIPMIEAMACGTPVACSRTSCMPEVAGDAAQYFDPYDAASIATACEAALAEGGQVRADRIALGFARAARFTWEEAARQTAAVFRRTL
ncbi:MAG: glycosyltransferase family 4 protein [Candidatus Wallbacteria bacterium]|nr:glycosyltransferase family 4 protein [Candidatus Wallbacteria bacterium]